MEVKPDCRTSGTRPAARDVGRFLGCESTLHPLVNLGGEELPKSPEFVRRHALPGDPLAGRVRIGSEMY